MNGSYYGHNNTFQGNYNAIRFLRTLGDIFFKAWTKVPAHMMKLTGGVMFGVLFRIDAHSFFRNNISIKLKFLIFQATTA